MESSDEDLAQRLAEFAAVARHFCQQIERVSESTDIDFLRSLLTTLPELYWRGQLLPDIDPWEDEDDEQEDGDEDASFEPPLDPRSDLRSGFYYAARETLDKLLAGHDLHRLVFDPFSPDDSMRDGVTASLADHLAEIYREVRDLLETESQQSAVEWNWHVRFGMNSHWGRMHLQPALHAIDWLVNHHWDDYEDRWQETWTPTP